ncbi:MAG: hypothetical protein E7171_05325 [Firmicutes bacterium]|nr:hypothetical protein [Bacillota bacterium]
MNKIIILVSLIPWILYLLFETKNNLYKLKDNHYLLLNIKNIIPIKNILLFILFLIFYYVHRKSAQIELVSSLLFATINLFLFIYSYYESNNYDLELSLKDKLTLIPITIIVFIITMISIYIKSILITYIILFTTSILNIILLYVSNKIISIVRRMNNEIKQL